MAKKTIVYFTKYTAAGPSSRYRSYQYFSCLEENGYTVTQKPLFPTTYIQILYGKGRKSMLVVVPAYIKRFFQVLFLKKHDIIFIEYELFPFTPYWIEKLLLWRRKNIVIDFDDAIFHNYDRSTNTLVKWLCGDKIYRLVKQASVVITGSPYLTQVLTAYCKRVVEIPTSIVYEKYQLPMPVKKEAGTPFRIGWIGSKYTSINLGMVTEAIKNLQEKYTVELALIGFDPLQMPLLEGVNCRVFAWDASTEVALIHSFDVGIMPLEDNDFNNGKCGFKLIQYMACGVATISTPLAANVKINRNHNNLHASGTAEWQLCFENILSNAGYFTHAVGEQNRQIVHDFYSVERNYIHYLDVFNDIISNKNS